MKFTEETELEEFFSEIDKVAFYGVGGMGRSLYVYLKDRGWEKKVAFFVVSKKKTDEFWGTIVKDVSQLDSEEISLPIVIATRDNFHDSIRASLNSVGATDTYTLSEDLLTHIECLANQSEQFDLGPVQKRYAAWVKRKQRIEAIWNSGNIGIGAKGEM